MNVGFLREDQLPTQLAKVLAITCKNFNIDLVYFRPEDILQKKNKIKGKILLNDTWEEITCPLPNFIDVPAYLFEHVEYQSILNYLARKTKLSIDRRHIISKDVLQKELVKDSKLKKYVIPMKESESHQDIQKFLKQYGAVVVKRSIDLEGIDKYLIEKRENDYKVTMKDNTLICNEEELSGYLKTTFNHNSFIVQQYIHSKTKTNSPFYCRIYLQKNGQNKWEVVHKYIRVGVGTDGLFDSTYNGVSLINHFLNFNYPNRRKELSMKLNQIGLNTAEKVEGIQKGDFMVMGVDIGIDPDGNMYIYSVSSHPSEEAQMDRISLRRPEYYNRFLRQSDKSKESKIEKLSEQIKDLQEEMDYLERKNERLIKDIVNVKMSTSWKVSKPVRFLGKYFKNK